jgi:hypothetical protein
VRGLWWVGALEVGWNKRRQMLTNADSRRLNVCLCEGLKKCLNTITRASLRVCVPGSRGATSPVRQPDHPQARVLRCSSY